MFLGTGRVVGFAIASGAWYKDEDMEEPSVGRTREVTPLAAARMAATQDTNP